MLHKLLLNGKIMSNKNNAFVGSSLPVKPFSGGMVRDNPEINRRVRDVTALGRAGVPEDIGPMIASLLSESNRWINAERIEVSGGMAI